jgi:kumamolisin
MPAIRDCLDTAFPVPAALAWLGLSPPGARILIHVDNTAHWDRHHRVHVPLQTSPEARICVSGRTVHMPAGSVWMFNNSRPHGALHDGPAERIHLIADLPDTAAVRDWLATGERIEGDADARVVEALSSDPMTRAAEDADAALLARFEAQ